MLGSLYVRRMWSFSQALDLALVDDEVARGLDVHVGERHGERVAYIALSVGKMLGLEGRELEQLTVAALLHDIGVVGSFHRYHGDPRMLVEHCLHGAQAVENFPDGEIISPMIRFHHETPNLRHAALGVEEAEVPLGARIISLADKIDLAVGRRRYKRAERDELVAWVKKEEGNLFYAQVGEAFERVVQKEAFWLDLEQRELMEIAVDILYGKEDVADYDGYERFTEQLALTFANLIDQKSEFTGEHSRSVAQTARVLAEALGWEERELHELYIAGLLHDLGKLSIPRKILDKPGPLDPDERDVIRTHTYYTHRLLKSAGFPRHMVHWAAYHHERLDGTGYPFAIAAAQLDRGARIMTIADIFTALTEERPYRKALTAAEALAIIERGVGKSVDGELVDLAKRVLG